MKRLPLLPTLLVAAGVAVMLGLGVWQLQRKAEKEALLTRYAAAQGLPPIAWPSPGNSEAALFRRSTVECARILGWRAEGGRNRQGDTGWVHIADCGAGVRVVTGWSERPEQPRWAGGVVSGVIGSDRDGIRLIATDPAPGLQPARSPSLTDVPNNHLFYAAQWFFFAAAAAVIYLLALGKRSR